MLDGCIVWNVHNTIFGSKSSAICNKWFVGPTRVLNTNGILITSVVFAGHISVTDRQTDRSRYSVANNTDLNFGNFSKFQMIFNGIFSVHVLKWLFMSWLIGQGFMSHRTQSSSFHWNQQINWGALQPWSPYKVAIMSFFQWHFRHHIQSVLSNYSTLHEVIFWRFENVFI